MTLFLFGALGAAAPEILRLYRLRTSHSPVPWTFRYILLSLPFYALGGVVVIALAPANAWTAIYIGISTPLIVNTIIKNGYGIRKMEQDGTGSVMAAKNPWVDHFLAAI